MVNMVRMRPRNVQKEKEFLYEEALKLKIRTNSFQEENTRLRTTVQILQNELTKKESMIAEMLQHDGGPAKMPRHQQKLMQKKVDSFLCNSLRKNIKDLKLQMDAKDEEITALKKNMKSTKIHELEVRLRPY